VVMRRLATLFVVAGVGLGVAACEPSSDCGRVLTRDTTLRADVVNCPGDGLVVGADGIELRLGGHTVDGAEGAGSAGIRIAGHDGVVVSGPGRITGFADGVRVQGGTGDRVRDLEATENGVGIHLVDADGGRVVGNQVTENENVQQEPHRGVLLEDAHGNLLSDNTVVEDDFTGIQLLRSHRNRLVGNAVNHADGTNIQLIESNDNEVVDNDASSSNGEAISLSASRRNLLTGNDVGNTASAGIRLRGSFDNRVIGNVAVRNDTDGIDVNDSTGTLVEGNEVVNSGVRGIHVRTFSGSSTGNRVRFNTVTGGDFFAGIDEDGIVVAAGATSTVVRGNTTNGNSDDGIDVDAPGTTIRENVANDNGDLGIEAVPGVTDGGGNRASGNGNPAQCTGVVCS
jgi:parallel beta-helix repeat protein